MEIKPAAVAVLMILNKLTTPSLALEASQNEPRQASNILSCARTPPAHCPMDLIWLQLSLFPLSCTAITVTQRGEPSC